VRTAATIWRKITSNCAQFFFEIDFAHVSGLAICEAIEAVYGHASPSSLNPESQPQTRCLK
jgi:hypothetical protein